MCILNFYRYETRMGHTFTAPGEVHAQAVRRSLPHVQVDEALACMADGSPSVCGVPAQGNNQARAGGRPHNPLARMRRLLRHYELPKPVRGMQRAEG